MQQFLSEMPVNQVFAYFKIIPALKFDAMTCYSGAEKQSKLRLDTLTLSLSGVPESS